VSIFSIGIGNDGPLGALLSDASSLGYDEPLVVSPQRGRKMLDVGNTRFYELIAAGEIESYKDGKSRKITVASIKAYIARRIQASR
jgi:excisionase family DNA binding protein